MSRKPDRLTLAAFLAIVVLLGVNFVAVKFSNMELQPFWGAALRFFTASALLFGIVKIRNIPLPQGRALIGAALFGLLGFGVTYGFLYLALIEVSAGMSSVLFAMLPLITLITASFIGLEKMSLRGILGAGIVVGGISIVFYEQLQFDVPLFSLIAVMLAVLSASLSGIVVKYFPKSHPASMNAIGMVVGALALFITSLIAGEIFQLPTLLTTWFALGWLIMSSIVAFVLMVWLIARWNASRVSYATVLFPLVTVVSATMLAEETVTLLFLAGSLLVLLGVYFGAISSKT